MHTVIVRDSAALVERLFVQFLVAGSYPHIARFVHLELPQVANRKRVFDALVHHGHLGLVEARQIVGSGPQVRLVITDRGPGRHGYYPGIGDTIQLAEVVARQYDALMKMAPLQGRRPRAWQLLIQDANAMLEGIILHHVVNWGAARGGHDVAKKTSLMRPQTEPGDEFEAQAYGKVLSKIPIAGWIGWSYVPDGDAMIATPYDEQSGYPPEMPSVESTRDVPERTQ